MSAPTPDLGTEQQIADLQDQLIKTPEGYVGGGTIYLVNNIPWIAPITANFSNKNVRTNAPVCIADAIWRCKKTNSTVYYVYLATSGEFYVDNLPGTVVAGQIGKYHPSETWRYIGYFLITASGVYQAGEETTTPNVPTIVGIFGGYRKNTIWLDVQSNLINFNRFEGQASSDNANWYAIRNDGVDWKGTANEDTDYPLPVITHEGIIPDGTTSAPTGRTLYYRFRAVNDAGQASDWCSGVSVTTTIVGTGDVGENTITSPKMVAGSVSTRELSVGDATIASEVQYAPAGLEYVSMDSPTLVSNLKRVSPTKATQYWPGKYGSVSNLYTPFTDRGAVGVFGTNTNYIPKPEDWSTATLTGTPGCAAVWHEALQKTVTKITFAAAGTNQAVAQLSTTGAVAGTDWCVSFCVYAESGGDVYLSFNDNNSWSAGLVTKVTLVAGLNYFNAAVTFAGTAAGTAINLLLMNYDMSANGADRARVVKTWPCTNGVDGKGGAQISPPVFYILWSSLSKTTFPVAYCPTYRSSGQIPYTRNMGTAGTVGVWERAGSNLSGTIPEGHYGVSEVGITNLLTYGSPGTNGFLLRRFKNHVAYDRTNCEDATNGPAVSGENPLLSNVTTARSTLHVHSGTYSYELTKSIAAGTAGVYDFQADETTSAMHGYLASHNMAFGFWLYLPSGVTNTKITLTFYEYYSATWNATNVTPAAVYDGWQWVNISKTLNASTAGTIMRLAFDSTLALNTKIYIDDVSTEFVNLEYYAAGPATVDLWDTTPVSAVWNHYAVTWAASSVKLLKNGVEKATYTTTMATSGVKNLYVGHRPAADVSNSWFNDLMLSDTQMATADILTYVTAAKPWYTSGDITLAEKSVVISPRGIEVKGQSPMGFYDAAGRYIEISPATGMRAKDAAGYVLHDLPDAPFLAGFYPCGHLYYVDPRNSWTLLFNTTPTTGSWNDISIGTYMNGITNIKAVLCNIFIRAYLASSTIATATVYFRPKGTTWDTSGAMATPYVRILGSGFSSGNHTFETTGTIICPIDSLGYFQYDCSDDITFLQVNLLGIYV